MGFNAAVVFTEKVTANEEMCDKRDEIFQHISHPTSPPLLSLINQPTEMSGCVAAGLLIHYVYNSNTGDKCPTECTCAKLFINLNPSFANANSIHFKSSDKVILYLCEYADPRWDTMYNCDCN